MGVYKGNIFAVDYTNLDAVIAMATAMASPEFRQYVVKYPGRDNYNVTMQKDRALREGAVIVWPKQAEK